MKQAYFKGVCVGFLVVGHAPVFQMSFSVAFHHSSRSCFHTGQPGIQYPLRPALQPQRAGGRAPFCPYGKQNGRVRRAMLALRSSAC